MAADDDMWDPNTWDISDQERRVYLDRNVEEYAVVDEVDYLWAIGWCWHVNQPHRARTGTKRYAVRNTGNGKKPGPKLYLHVEIMRRTGIERPSEAHVVVDHVDGNELDCRRHNLRWATHKMNRCNVRKR